MLRLPALTHAQPTNSPRFRGVLAVEASRIRTGDYGFRAWKTARSVVVSVGKLGGSVEAQRPVTFSNSMNEAFWRSLKHSWLYLHSLESVESLRRLVDFYVRQHNEVMPHAAFEGQYFGVGDAVVAELYGRE